MLPTSRLLRWTDFMSSHLLATASLSALLLGCYVAGTALRASNKKSKDNAARKLKLSPSFGDIALQIKNGAKNGDDFVNAPEYDVVIIGGGRFFASGLDEYAV